MKEGSLEAKIWDNITFLFIFFIFFVFVPLFVTGGKVSIEYPLWMMLLFIHFGYSVVVSTTLIRLGEYTYDYDKVDWKRFASQATSFIGLAIAFTCLLSAVALLILTLLGKNYPWTSLVYVSWVISNFIAWMMSTKT